ncbi:hypothetical protein [Polycladomyces subterraneus]|uniref:Cardiolipin synthase N-terminal domain-containing protein n=1 Tax=Polycladomyces subterraneus TaxID=1016997 RepID=A0ABT8IQ59_9BACL|nr:hypothetical protein [Polycladomyces subterraneus]MDN4594930.1 hypothetical protein [Polycladomyces subterraneus]
MARRWGNIAYWLVNVVAFLTIGPVVNMWAFFQEVHAFMAQSSRPSGWIVTGLLVVAVVILLMVHSVINAVMKVNRPPRTLILISVVIPVLSYVVFEYLIFRL